MFISIILHYQNRTWISNFKTGEKQNNIDISKEKKRFHGYREVKHVPFQIDEVKQLVNITSKDNTKTKTNKQTSNQSKANNKTRQNKNKQ